MHTLLLGDALELLTKQSEASFDGMLSDPPYGINLMKQEWDECLPSVSVWRECLRVLRPGAFALIACTPRTQHRMIVNVEDAGFEVRDIIAWVHASGFGRNSDVSEGLDKLQGVTREVVSVGRGRSGKAAVAEGVYVSGTHAWPGEFNVTRPATPLAERWADYGSRLKPSLELWTLVRKPLAKRTIPENVLAHDVGGLNIGASRVPFASVEERNAKVRKHEPSGRWPANVILHDDPQVTALFPNVRGGSASRFFTRLQYCPKASNRERGNGNDHTAVKPITLTTYLATLLLPPPRESEPRRLIVPYAGSGSEMIGALKAGWDEVVGIEIDPHFTHIALERLRDVVM